MERLDENERPNRRWRVIEGGGGGGASEETARPVPEDYGLTPADLRIWYAPGRVGALLALAATAGMAALQAYDGARVSDPWLLGALGGLLYGALIGGFAGLGLLVLVHWCDPMVGWAWPVYARLRRYREALAAARAAERTQEGS
ncbi:hypothetical protein [Azospirillum sp. sgz302134]